MTESELLQKVQELQAQLAEIQARAETAEAAACRMREACQSALEEFIGTDAVYVLEPEKWMRVPDTIDKLKAALASTSPCPHAAEVTELRKLCGEAARFQFRHLGNCASHSSAYGNRCNCGKETIATRLRAAEKGGK